MERSAYTYLYQELHILVRGSYTLDGHQVRRKTKTERSVLSLPVFNYWFTTLHIQTNNNKKYGMITRIW